MSRLLVLILLLAATAQALAGAEANFRVAQERQYGPPLISTADTLAFAGWTETNQVATAAVISAGTGTAPDGSACDVLLDNGAITLEDVHLNLGVAPVLGKRYWVSGYTKLVTGTVSINVKLHPATAGAQSGDMTIIDDLTASSGSTSSSWVSSDLRLVPVGSGWASFGFEVLIASAVGTGNIEIVIRPAFGLHASYTTSAIGAQGSWAVWRVQVQEIY